MPFVFVYVVCLALFAVGSRTSPSRSRFSFASSSTLWLYPHAFYSISEVRVGGACFVALCVFHMPPWTIMIMPPTTLLPLSQLTTPSHSQPISTAHIHRQHPLRTRAYMFCALHLALSARVLPVRLRPSHLTIPNLCVHFLFNVIFSSLCFPFALLGFEPLFPSPSPFSTTHDHGTGMYDMHSSSRCRDRTIPRWAQPRYLSIALFSLSSG
ncbi:hypothetical protein FA95DRAFT_800602 [Auriscalpium vulgare]|uniref:Uncharacterized protein n=1 Tax=Auriscalpium vulgare TaxID=40419 RepID=A0ACB8S0B7_9AGAM|nr:hypothetical protein FA95DRAFT_800602 [Auriscalpium vulgare]